MSSSSSQPVEDKDQVEGMEVEVLETPLINQSGQLEGPGAGEEGPPSSTTTTPPPPVPEIQAPFMFGCSLNPDAPMFNNLQEMLLEELLDYEEALRGDENQETSGNNSPPETEDPPAIITPPMDSTIPASHPSPELELEVAPAQSESSGPIIADNAHRHHPDITRTPFGNVLWSTSRRRRRRHHCRRSAFQPYPPRGVRRDHHRRETIGFSPLQSATTVQLDVVQEEEEEEEEQVQVPPQSLPPPTAGEEEKPPTVSPPPPQSSQEPTWKSSLSELCAIA